MLYLRGHADHVRSLAFAPGGGLLASAGGRDGTVRLWDLVSGREAATLGKGRPQQLAVAFSPDGRTLASAGPAVTLWDVDGSRLRDVLKDVSGSVCALAFSPDGSGLATGSGPARGDRRGFRHVVVVYDISTASVVMRSSFLDGVELRYLAYAPDGRELAVGTAAGDVIVLSSADGTLRRTLRAMRSIRALAYAPDGRRLAVAGDRVQLWDPQTWRQLGSLDGHRYLVTSAAFTPDGRALLTAGCDFTARVWDVEAMQERAQFNPSIGDIFSLAIAPDGLMAAAGGWEQIVVWDLDPGLWS